MPSKVELLVNLKAVLDGPPVVSPTHKGFGHILLEKAVAQEFGEPPKVRFSPEGLTYEIDAPLSVVAAVQAAVPAAVGAQLVSEVESPKFDHLFSITWVAGRSD